MMPDHCSRLHSAFPRLGATTGRDECQLGGQEHGPTARRRAEGRPPRRAPHTAREARTVPARYGT